MLNRFGRINKLVSDIKTIKIQWATNIAKAGILILWEEIRKQKFWSIKEFEIFFKKAVEMIRAARETEPMLFNWINKINAEYAKNKKNLKIEVIQKKLSDWCLDYVKEIEKEEKIRPIIWAKLIKDKYNVMTHCHSWSVVRTLSMAWRQGKKFHVYNTETRPLYQWRKTSKDLLAVWIPDTMITDDAAPFFVDNLYESHVRIDMVLIGCDAIKLDGSVYNKVGSFAIALSAWHAGIPVYIVGSLTKVDEWNKVKIEKRPWKEIWPDAPKWLEIINYAFDMVPAKFITWIITEYGVIKPSEIKKYVKKYYPRF